MAFTNTPTNDTYSSEKVNAAVDLQLRPALDSFNLRFSPGMTNLHPIKAKINGADGVIAETRQQVVAGRVVAGSSLDPLRGIYVWEKTSSQIYYFVVDDKKIYTSTTGLPGSWTNVTTFLTTLTSPVGFTEFIDATNVKKLVIVDGVEGYVFTSNAAGTKIVDADFPTPHVPFPVFLDGYLFLAKASTGDIYNSNLNDPALWTAGDFISSELYPDDIQALVKVNNYLLAIGTQGSEFFYDAGIATGSPLAREEGSSLPFGTTLPYTIACNKNMVTLLANSNDGSAVFKIIEDKKHKEIDNTWLVPFVSNFMAQNGEVGSSFRGFFIRHGSDLCYCFKNPRFLGCFVYSFTTGMWTEYSSSVDIYGFAVDCAAFSTSGSLSTFVGGNADNGDIFFGTLGYTLFSSGITTDALFQTGYDFFNASTSPSIIDHEIRTPALDFGTLNQKALHRMGVYMEKKNDGSAGNPTITLDVYYNDFDDQSSVGSGPYTIDATGLTNFAFVQQLGIFRQRRFTVRYSGAVAISVKQFEFSINKHRT